MKTTPTPLTCPALTTACDTASCVEVLGVGFACIYFIEWLPESVPGVLNRMALALRDAVSHLLPGLIVRKWQVLIACLGFRSGQGCNIRRVS